MKIDAWKRDNSCFALNFYWKLKHFPVECEYVLSG